LSNGSRIADTGDYAYIPANAIGNYAVLPLHSYSFVEALIGRDSTGSSGASVVNFELWSRRFVDPTTGVIRLYELKFIRNRYGAGDQPDIVLGVGPCPPEFPSTSCLADTGGPALLGILKRFTIPTSPSADQPTCYGMPTLATNSNNRVWIGLTVKDDVLSFSPHLFGTVAWNNDPNTSCQPSNDITGCDHVCQADVLDTSSAATLMLFQLGTFGYFAHDVNYRMWVIRAGSAAQ
jgi:hypothetical protein